MRKYSDIDQTITVDVFPWVYNFITEKHFFIGNKVVTESNNVGLYLLGLLTDNKKSAYCYKSTSIEKGNLKQMVLYLPKKRAYQISPILTPQRAQQFNEFCERLLKYELFTILDFSKTYTDLEIKAVINDFLDQYQITDGPFNYESLNKAYYRERKEREKICT